tara:strand:+ start:24 stop:629 length:606 start_codon:yes stop_codon:yes gene_type:complete
LSEEKDLWKLVRQEISDSKTKNILQEVIEEEYIGETIEEQTKKDIRKEDNKEVKKTELKNDFTTIELLNEGVFAGFLYIFVIMIILGILTIPGSITAAIGGFFGGKKAGDPARALTAAMLPFLIIAALYFLVSFGALPPGSGPNDVATEISDMLNHSPEKNLLGPISKMPDSNSSVFVSVVTFAFIGGLVNIENNKQENTN